MTLDVARIRKDFPILDREVRPGVPLVYLDNAATSQKPTQVLDAMRDYYERHNANVHRGIHTLAEEATALYEGARDKVARFINASTPSEVVFTKNSSEALNLLAHVLPFGAGDEVVVTEMEHHSNLVPWQLLAERTGARLRFVPVGEDGTLRLEELPALLTPEVKIFAFTHISNSLGTINPVAELCQAARAAGAVTLVDAAQSAGHVPIDVQALGCDFLAFSGHKMCAPTGIGALYGRADLLNAMPPWHGGGEMILSVTYEKSTYKQSPHRFEAGTPNIADAVGLGVAVDYLESIGRAAIFEHDAELAAYAQEGLATLSGVRVHGPLPRAGLVGFTMDAAHPHDLTTYADQHGLALRGGHHCNQPLMRKMGLPGTTRASFYFYNSKAEIDRMIEILEAAVRFFAV